MTAAETMGMELAYQIQKRLYENSLTAEVFAQQCGVPEELVKQAMEEESIPIEAVQKICDTLGISVDSLRRMPVSGNPGFLKSGLRGQYWDLSYGSPNTPFGFGRREICPLQTITEYSGFARSTAYPACGWLSPQEFSRLALLDFGERQSYCLIPATPISSLIISSGMNMPMSDTMMACWILPCVFSVSYFGGTPVF